VVNVIPQNSWLIYFQDLSSQTTEPFEVTALGNCVIQPFTMNERRSVLNNLKSNKAPGKDLTNLELQQFPV
jgi:hypothetical protein